MTAFKLNWSWIILSPLLLLGLTACEEDEPGARTDDTAVAGSTVGVTPDDANDTDDNDVPDANEVPEIVRDGLETTFGDAEWVNDVGDIERDGDTVRFKLDRSYADAPEAFEDACNAVADVVMDTGILDVDTVEVTDEDGDVVMGAEGESECEPA